MRSFEIQGHRGARGLFPENTLAGFRAALKTGVTSFELDVAITADGIPVVAHDPTLNPDITRTRDGAWLTTPGPAIRTLTLAELQTYEVGRINPASAYATLYPDQQPEDGATIPTLAEVLAIDATIRFNIEIKSVPQRTDLTLPGPTMADAALAIADALGVTARIWIESFDWSAPRHIKRTRPDVQVAWLTSPEHLKDARRWWNGHAPDDFNHSIPQAIAAEGGGTWAPHYKDLTQDQIAEAHQLGLKVLPWTVNDPEDMTRLITWHTDGLITDRPDLLVRALASMGLRPKPHQEALPPGPPLRASP